MTRDTTEIAREIAYELRGDQLPWSNRGTAIMDRALLADRIAAAIEKDRAEREAWLPIETAPRDGAHVLAWAHGWGPVEALCVGFFEESDEPIWAAYYADQDITPTHWRPLPSPPSEESSS